MRRAGQRFALVGIITLLTLGLAWAEDEVHRRSGGVPLRGTIVEENPIEIVIQRKDNGKNETVALNEVARVKYDGKIGLDMSQAEILEQGGEYQKAADAYAKVLDEAAGKQFPTRSASYGRVRSLAKLAQREAGQIDDAIKAIEEYRTQNPLTRFHYPLHEMLGQLQLARGDTDAAAAAFAELGKAPWPDYQLKARIYEGRILLARGDYDAAIAKFDAVTTSAGSSAEEKLRQQEALLGKAECLVKQKNFDEAETALRQVIDTTSSDEGAIHAAAFNLLGDSQRQTGKPKAAILSYLYVDLLYPNERDEHAKSLCYIALLWDQLGRADRAEDTRSRLKKDYPNSSWAKLAAEQPKP